MTDSIAQMKTCKTCGIEKPIDEFYEHNGFRANQCKVCKITKSKQYKSHDKRYSPNYGENLVIEKLKSMGIYASPGKSSEWKRIDVVAWGCVKIEVKTANLGQDGAYNFGFRTQAIHGLKSDLILLIPLAEKRSTFHLFRPDHPVFFRTGGGDHSIVSPTGRKYGLIYNPNRSNIKATYGETLSYELMTEHQDRWDLIEQCRLDIMERLIFESSVKNAIVGQLPLI